MRKKVFILQFFQALMVSLLLLALVACTHRDGVPTQVSQGSHPVADPNAPASEEEPSDPYAGRSIVNKETLQHGTGVTVKLSP